ncbi:hypothetical protein FOZ61_004368 [Perkinsus olseni]|uniref:Uncharacterized protein n=1 Tax=Perkinsus olseni TaxID=32597 RepID=A0A7J6MCT6_PEROL|nr:hypothetical protein FOZ61_004368 [Perkinsus olseni]KAF4674626.1 hypothetical protein FOL46_004413 [Perkinsus olseni]
MEYEVYFGCNLVGTIAVVLIFFYTYSEQDWSNTAVRMWTVAVLEQLQRQQQCHTLFFKERRRVGTAFSLEGSLD